jgi:tetratricopeptide (TPR) repeat protein
MLPMDFKDNQAAVRAALLPLQERAKRLDPSDPRKDMFEKSETVYGYTEFREAVHRLQRKKQHTLLNKVFIPLQVNPEDLAKVVRENFDAINRDFFTAVQTFQADAESGAARALNREGEIPGDTENVLARVASLAKGVSLQYVAELARRVTEGELTVADSIEQVMRDEVLAIFDIDLLEAMNGTVPEMTQRSPAMGHAAIEMLMTMASHYGIANEYLDAWLTVTTRWLLARIQDGELTLWQAQAELATDERSKTLPFEALADLGRYAVQAANEDLLTLCGYLAQVRNEERRFMEAVQPVPLDRQMEFLEGEVGQWILANKGIDQLLMIYGGAATRYERHNRFESAVNVYEKGRQLAKEYGKWKMYADFTWEIGKIRLNQSNYNEAEIVLAEALQIFEGIGDKRGVAKVQIDIANCKRYRGYLEESVDLYEAAKAYFVQTGDDLVVAICEENIAIAYKNLGRYEQALTAYYHVRGIFQAHHEYNRVANSEYNIGNIYADLRDYQRAMQLYLSALEKWEQDDDLPHVALCKHAIANVLLLLDYHREAFDYFDEAAKTFSQVGHMTEAVIAALGMAQTVLELDLEQSDLEGILEFFWSVRDVLIEQEMLRESAVAYTVEAQILQRLNRLDEALEAFAQAEALSPQFPDLNWALRYYTGKVHEQRGDPSLAFEEYQAAVEILESIWRALNLREAKTFYISDKQVHRAAIRLAYQLARRKEAIEYLERYKSQAMLLELGLTAPIPMPGVTTGMIATEKSLLEQLRQKVASGEALEAVEVSQQLRKFYQDLGAANEAQALQEYISIRNGVPLSYESMRSILEVKL